MIYFSRHVPAPNELELVRSAVESGVTSGDGQFTTVAKRLLSDMHDGAEVLLTTSGTHALELAALVLELGHEDEVVLPSFTFSSTANAFALRGCKLKFADIDPQTFSMELPQLLAALTPNTRVVVTVAYGGVLRDWEAIVQVCSERGIALVEDNAHGLFSRHKNRPFGTFGRVSALSFHGTKNISCGEGGALVVNDPELLRKAETIREKGTDRARFLRGDVDKYTWREIGSSYLPSDILAAVLAAQLQNSARSQERRHAVWNFYREALEKHAARFDITLQTIPIDTSHPAHVFAIVVPASIDRNELLRSLVREKVTAVSHYEPLHLAPANKGEVESLPVTEHVAGQLVRLPLYAGLSLEDARFVSALFVRKLEELQRSDKGST